MTRLPRLKTLWFFALALIALSPLAPARGWAQPTTISSTSGLECSNTSGSPTCTTLAGQAPSAAIYSPQYSGMTVENAAGTTIGQAAIMGVNSYTAAATPAPSLIFENNGSLQGTPDSKYTIDVESLGMDTTMVYMDDKYPAYYLDGGAAGAVTVNDTGTVGTPGKPSVFTIPIAPGGGIYSQPTPGGFILPQGADLFALSLGGSAGSQSKNAIGTAGTGNAVNVTLGSNAALPLANDISGVFAVSAGGTGSGYGSNYTGGRSSGPVDVELYGCIGRNACTDDTVTSAADAFGVYAFSGGGASGQGDYKSSGRGGNAGTVTVNLNSGSSIAMLGDQSIGVFAASIGGLSWYTNDGSQDGNGNNVTVTVADGASVSTSGELGVGIAALSSGGNATSGQYPPPNEGDGVKMPSSPFVGPSGNAGDVVVTNNGTISTAGNVAIGIAAVSSSGGRGVGEMVDNEIDQIGATGSGAGVPGTVTVTNNGAIGTDGAGAIGVLAMSLGGPGGLLDSSPGVLNYLGGTKTAGTGTDGQEVQVYNAGSITTSGAVSMGIVAESIGGGGTATGTAGIAAVGTKGGTGGNGGTVEVMTENGTISTAGIGSFGILMQSIGGGGGNGGTAHGVVAAVGGAGGNGGNGGLVRLEGSSQYWTNKTTGDFSPGVVLQSIGGGGGNGGYSATWTLLSVITPVSAAVGGTGGGGGNGAEVDIYEMPGEESGSITTSGVQSPGLLEQSIGGGGGNGGAAESLDSGVFFADSTAVGGTGGKGGNGGLAKFESDLRITTNGDDSGGIIAQSIGGGGGSGGSALSRTEALPSTIADIPTLSISTAIGGTGGSGGSGGAVWGTNDSVITTHGNNSAGISAQSVGGGGGNGGDSSAYARALEAVPQTLLISLSLSGDGSIGGNGGEVNVANGGQNLDNGGTIDPCNGCTGSITTTGNNAAGIIAQSIGGGGGNAGAANASATGLPVSSSGGSSMNITIALGGVCTTDISAQKTACKSAGGGGAGGDVYVNNMQSSSITTSGSGSQGILAQSVGGGGGNGGGAATAGSGDTITLGVALGSSGGDGGAGKTVTVNNAGTIITGGNANDGTTDYTTGGDADGILAQSIGGGGGVGGSTDAAANVSTAYDLLALLNNPSKSFEADVSVGGSGGSGGNGGTVDITSPGSITTYGERAYGILAQSIGGGGGVGGAVDASANSYWFASGLIFAATVSVGGSGGSGGNGGTVMADSTGGSITTAGYGAIGMAAQSIGGGGGIGAEATVGNTTTFGLGTSASGSGGGAGYGGTVTANSGQIITIGDDSYGVLAQSIGGGGGLGSGGCTNTKGASFQGITGTLCYNNDSITASGAPWNAASSFSIHVGGGDGSSGTGGTVMVNATSNIATAGARAFGIVAQSIGGGGGIFTTSASNIIAASAQTSLEKNNSTGGGDVIVNLAANSSITTSGDGAWGILAQSIALGGGFAGDPSLNITAPLLANIGDYNGTYRGLAGRIDVNLSSSIITTGMNAHGIVAQSLGGGGGIQDNSSNNALELGDNVALSPTGTTTEGGIGNAIQINVNMGAQVITKGAGSVAILAQSSDYSDQLGEGYAASTVNVYGTVTGGTNTGYTGTINYDNGALGAAGIVISGGSIDPSTPNDINVYAGGILDTEDGTGGTAILTDAGYTNVMNEGTLTGSIYVAGTVVNHGTLNGGKQMTASLVTNSGVFSVGSDGAPFTQLDGDYVQTGAGRLQAGIDALAPQDTLLNITGSAQVSGQIVAAARRLLPGTYTVLRASSLSSNATAASTLLYSWRVERDNSLAITPLANFKPPGVAIDASAVSLAAYMTRGWNNADKGLASQFGYLSQIMQASQYTTALDSYSAKATQGQITSLLLSSTAFLGAAMSCPIFTGDSVRLGEDECVWAKISGQTSNGWANNDSAGYNITSSTYRLGGQRAVARDWYVGGSFGATQSWATANGGSSGSGAAYDGSIAVKHTAGAWLFAASLAMASGAYHSTRLINLPAIGTLNAINALAQSDPSVLALGGRLRCAYEFSFKGWYIRPYGDFDIIYAHMPGFQESGGSGYALNVDTSNKTNLVLSPMVEVGGRYNAGAKTTLRPFLAMGVSLWPTSGRTVEASFAGAQDTNGTFKTYVDTPRIMGNIDAGVQLYRIGGFEVKAEYNISVGGTYLSQGATARLAYHF